MRQCDFWGWGRAVVMAGGVMAAGGCTRNVELQPFATSQTALGVLNAAVAEAAGVRVTIEGAPWRGDPRDLGTLITPVRVTIENGASVPLRVLYEDFALIIPQGYELRALPPLRLDGPAFIASSSSGPARSFYVAAPYGRFYPGLAVWPEPFEVDRLYHEANYFWDAPLPTPDMLKRALPEGVVGTAGLASGFVYFQPLPARTTSAIIAFTLVNARTGRQFERIEIPFRVMLPSAR